MSNPDRACLNKTGPLEEILIKIAIIGYNQLKIKTIVKKENVISQRPDLVVFDEAHQAIASSYTAGLSHLGCFDLNSPTPLLGLSATPGRGTESETEDLVNMFQERLLTAPSLI